ncbi:hypothetical protein ACHAXS_000876 [Conticribra weissflogii]
MFVDGDHAGDQHTQRFLSGFLIYLNTALISWYSKRQSMIETCTFSVEALHEIHYKLRVMGIPIDVATHIDVCNK